eukprot:scaffold30564_cov58-Phaeocystis_antarctica.AAC.5
MPALSLPAPLLSIYKLGVPLQQPATPQATAGVAGCCNSQQATASNFTNSLRLKESPSRRCDGLSIVHPP